MLFAGKSTINLSTTARWASAHAIASFVTRYQIRTVREYKTMVADFHARKEHLNIPISASKVYKKPWKSLLFENKKYCSYEAALYSLRKLQVFSKIEFESLTDDLRRAHKLPASLHYYREFKGWANFRKSLVPDLEKLRQYCFIKKIYSQAQYSIIADSDEGRALSFPKNPQYSYGKKWRGWYYLLPVKEFKMTLEDRARLMWERSEKMKEKRAA